MGSTTHNRGHKEDGSRTTIVAQAVAILTTSCSPLAGPPPAVIPDGAGAANVGNKIYLSVLLVWYIESRKLYS